MYARKWRELTADWVKDTLNKPGSGESTFRVDENGAKVVTTNLVPEAIKVQREIHRVLVCGVEQ